jgi:polyribonucleotide 5'-hydroxyl-kinase
VRYLRARQWDFAKAEAMLRATLDWRLSFKPHALTWADVEREAATGKLFVSPHPDIDGRPVVIMRPRHENSRDREGQLRLLVYVLEVASRRADAAVMAAATTSGNANNAPFSSSDSTAPVFPSQAASSALPDGKMCWLVDFERYGLSNAPPIRTALATMEILQNHYPERLGKSICWRAPSLFSVTWKAVGPLVDPVTRQKIAFVEDAAAVGRHFDPEHVEECCGGLKKGELFEREKYGEAMRREEEEREKERLRGEAAYPGGFLPSGSSDASAASLVALAGAAARSGSLGGAM